MLTRTLKNIKRPSLASKLTPLAVYHNHSSKPLLFSSNSALKNSTSPWYLDPKESPSITSPLKNIQLPTLPDNHPGTLENLTIYLTQELGIDDVLVFDMRNKSNAELPEGAYDLSDFMVIGTGKSAKHLQKASSELDFYIKHNLHKLPSTEGIVKSGELARYHRRLQRKGKKAPNYSKFTYGVAPNTWVMTDTKTDGIIIHMLTKERRIDLNLEHLWSTDSEKSKYRSNRSAYESDDIFRGVRYFHTSRVSNSTFDAYNLTFGNYSDHFKSLLRSHLVDSNSTPLSALKNHLDLMYSAGFNINYDLLSSYFQTILQSDEFHKNIKSDSQMFNHRQMFLLDILDNYHVNLETDELLKLISLLVISGSNFGNESFLTLKKIVNTFNIQQEKVFQHSKSLKVYATLSETIIDSFNTDHRKLKREIDLFLLCVFANRLNWTHFFQILDSAINRNDVQIIQTALPFVAICADLVTITKFEQAYLPLIIESGFPSGFERFTDIIYDKTHPNQTN